MVIFLGGLDVERLKNVLPEPFEDVSSQSPAAK
jgi:hypothetical protein